MTTEIGRFHDDLFGRMTARAGYHWRIAFMVTGGLTGMFFGLLIYTAFRGIGVWGNNIPNGWAFGITNYVYWIGIGFAGTFISTILFLLEQHSWRNPISRLTDAMTLFAIVIAALFPIFHLGRPWFGYWLLPYPDVMGVWPNVKSALPWDAAAITTYFILSLIFLYLGMLPDFASLRDHSRSRVKQIAFGILAMGWQGSANQWRHYRIGYLMLAAILAPLGVSIHSVVSSCFAIGITPSWHSTMMPPYFVIGAIMSGFGVVVSLAIPTRYFYRLEHVITDRVLDNCARVILVTSLLLTWAYGIEHFGDYYHGDPADRTLLAQHAVSWMFWLMIFCNVVVPQLLWWRKARRNTTILFFIGLVVVAGTWIERYVIIVPSLSHGHLPSAWRGFMPTLTDMGILVGTFGTLAFLYLAFIRFFPFIPTSEMKEDLAENLERAE